MRSIRIYSLANAGIYLESGDASVMIDGLNKPTAHFDGISNMCFEDMLAGKGFVGDGTFLLYTHTHQDHFDADKNIIYVKEKKARGIFLPFSDSEDYQGLSSCAAENGTELFSPVFGRDAGGKVQIADFQHNADSAQCTAPVCGPDSAQCTDITLKYFAAPHTGREYEGTPHYCLLLELGGYRTFVSGDADHMNGAWQPPVLENKIDIAFVNPFFINRKEGRAFIEQMAPSKLFVYHLPPKELDEFRIRSQAAADLRKYGNQLDAYDTELVDEPMKIIFGNI
jgi:L-ascorbate metabolism protein UlaG (beta-lactamase superfamily)